jgi:hypothetical protein
MFRRQALLFLVATSFAIGDAAFGDDVAGTQPDYFPKAVFSDRADVDDLVRSWYSRQLRALEEPSLYPPKQFTEIYRFTWLRTFHNPMVFRFTVHDDGAGTLIVKRTNGAGGYKPGVVDMRKDITLSKGQVDELKRNLDDMSYWEQPTKLKTRGMDGAQWIVEANANGKYMIVDRWSDSDPAIQAWGMQLITVSGVDVGEVY